MAVYKKEFRVLDGYLTDGCKVLQCLCYMFCINSWLLAMGSITELTTVCKISHKLFFITFCFLSLI